MNKSILVTYASKYGATAEIAGKVGEVLRQAGLQADVLSVESVQDPSKYQAVILGSALYVGKWQKGAEAFLKANEKELSSRPVWLFSSGPTGEGSPVDLLGGQRLPASLQQAVERIKPRDVAVFHGFINRDKMNIIEKWAIKNIVKKPFGDFRDWQMISAWANTIAGTLKSAARSG